VNGQQQYTSGVGANAAIRMPSAPAILINQGHGLPEKNQILINQGHGLPEKNQVLNRKSTGWSKRRDQCQYMICQWRL
jgi:hypothetical protein